MTRYVAAVGKSFQNEVIDISKYGHIAVARQLKRARKHTRKLFIYLGRVIRDIERKLPQPDVAMAVLLGQAKQIEQQKRSDSNKLYGIHAPEVECIAKGKVHKRYEFGCKLVFTAIPMTARHSAM